MSSNKKRINLSFSCLLYTSIVDKEPTTDSEGSKHKECENCGEKLETAEIEKLYNSGTTDSKGEAVVGGYLVTVTEMCISDRPCAVWVRTWKRTD